MTTEQMHYTSTLALHQFTLHINAAFTTVISRTTYTAGEIVQADPAEYDTFDTYGEAREAITNAMAATNAKRLH